MKKLVFVILTAVLFPSLMGCSVSGEAGKQVVLLTDYSDNNYNAPQLKGIITTSYPEAVIIDATHNIAGMDVAAGAYVLELTAREFPAKAVFIAAVGSPALPGNRYLVLLTNKDQVFLAPDNGLLSNVIDHAGIKGLYSITNSKLYLKPGETSTDQDLYILGRTAALLASGHAIDDVGPEVNDPVLLSIQKAAMADGKLTGSVVFIDNFGNCLTNITAADFTQAGLKIGDYLQLSIEGSQINMKIGTGYGSVPEGDTIAFINSLDILELAVNYGNFSKSYGLESGARIKIEQYIPDAAETTLATLRQKIQQELDDLAFDAAAAAAKLSEREYPVSEIREILNELMADRPYIVDCSIINLDGELAIMEPASYREYEGSDVSGQDQVIQLFLYEKPVLSQIFQAVEGFYAADLEYPLFSAEGRMTGALSILFKPETLLGDISADVQENPFSVWAMQPDGLMLFDADPAEIGKNTYTDPVYQSFKQVIFLARKMTANRSGSGYYSFYNTGLQKVVNKRADWTTVGLFGTEWRLIVSQVIP